LSAVAVQAGGNGAGINHFIADFQADLADDGLVNGSAPRTAVRAQIDAASAAVDMAKVATNVNTFFNSSAATATALSNWVDSSGGADGLIDKFKTSVTEVATGTLSMSPAYVAGSEEVGQCLSVGSLSAGANGALYPGNSTTPSNVLKVSAKGDRFYLGMTAGTTGTVGGFIQRFVAGAKGVCPATAPASGATRVFKYSLVNTLPSAITLRPLRADFSTRKAVSYSPFRTSSRDTEVITDANVLQDLTLLSQGGFKLIRLFDSSDNVSKRVLRLLSANPGLDIKVMLGAYMLSESSPYITDAQRANSRSFNQAEIARAAKLAQDYATAVAAVSVGNETMVSWSFVPNTPATIAGYITTLRSQITQPLTTDDNWAFFAGANGEPNDPKAVLNAVDFVAVHTYPLADSTYNTWTWKQASAAAMMDAAIAKAKADVSAVRTHLDSRGFSGLPIVIGETGWKATMTNGETFRAHPANQRMYFERLATWAGSAGAPKAIFYFEAFDEPWKGGDDGWGLFSATRQPRCAVKNLYPSLTPETSACSDAQALYYIAPVSYGTVTANRFTAYADTVTPGEARPAETPRYDAWQNGTTADYAQTTAAASPGDPGNGIAITPKPLEWGWGLALNLPKSTADLSNFTGSSARLNFSISTTYAGKLEVGFFTGSATDGTGFDVYLPMMSGDYGYVNDGNWHQVSIPISAIIPRGAPAYGMPSSVRLDMTKVQSLFTIADRYAVTGNAKSFTPIKVDAVYWSK
jgi:exo-beta-1,3-glucanase (GH17 family)